MMGISSRGTSDSTLTLLSELVNIARNIDPLIMKRLAELHDEETRVTAARREAELVIEDSDAKVTELRSNIDNLSKREAKLVTDKAAFEAEKANQLANFDSQTKQVQEQIKALDDAKVKFAKEIQELRKVLTTDRAALDAESATLSDSSRELAQKAVALDAREAAIKRGKEELDKKIKQFEDDKLRAENDLASARAEFQQNVARVQSMFAKR